MHLTAPLSHDFRLGIDRLVTEAPLQSDLKGKRVAILGHPASMTSPTMGFESSIDALSRISGFTLSAALGPQHGMRGDKQDNMIESEDTFDPKLGIPVFSLYGKVRRPTAQMMDHFDVLLFDVQDVGCRVYTFLTTLFYCLQACAQYRKSIWVLDRPNPAGRPVEGHSLLPGHESFVGAMPEIPMRHGLTLGEAALWFQKRANLNVDLRVIPMLGYDPDAEPGCGWPSHSLPWVNPSPNAASLNMARCYPGTVMLEGTTLSEGRGTTRALEQFGAPDLPLEALLEWMQQKAPQWMKGAAIRPCYFEPTFHKHSGRLVRGAHFHTDLPSYQHFDFKPYRWMALFFKAILAWNPKYPLWRDFPYEYETEKLAIDVICGGPQLRKWVENPNSEPELLERDCRENEQAWIESVRSCLLYPASAGR